VKRLLTSNRKIRRRFMDFPKAVLGFNKEHDFVEERMDRRRPRSTRGATERINVLWKI